MSEVVAVLLKDADETLTLSIDWADTLGAGESISGTPVWAIEDTWAGDPSPLSTTGSPSLSGTIASQQVTGGSRSHVYRARCRMTTSAGQVYDRSWTVRIGTR